MKKVEKKEDRITLREYLTSYSSLKRYKSETDVQKKLSLNSPEISFPKKICELMKFLREKIKDDKTINIIERKVQQISDIFDFFVKKWKIQGSNQTNKNHLQTEKMRQFDKDSEIYSTSQFTSLQKTIEEKVLEKKNCQKTDDTKKLKQSIKQINREESSRFIENSALKEFSKSDSNGTEIKKIEKKKCVQKEKKEFLVSSQGNKNLQKVPQFSKQISIFNIDQDDF